MLAKRARELHRPFGRPKWAIALPLVAAAVIAAAGWLAASSVDRALQPTAVAGRSLPRVVYVSYVDDATDERSIAVFERLSAHVAALDPKRRTPLALEFVTVVIGQGPTIEESLRAIAATNPAVIVATSHDVLEAAKLATSRIPLLFLSHADPVEAGHVRSIAAPGVPRTGFTFHAPTLEKAVELLLDGYPRTRKVGIVVDALAARQVSTARAVHAAQTALHLKVELVVAHDSRELAQALARSTAQSIDAWYVPSGAALWNDRVAVMTMLNGTGKPVLYDRIARVREGGLMAYEPRLVDPIGIWASQLLLIVQGVDAASIPIELPSRFELALNLDVAAQDRLRPSTDLVERVDVFVTRTAAR